MSIWRVAIGDSSNLAWTYSMRLLYNIGNMGITIGGYSMMLQYKYGIIEALK